MDMEIAVLIVAALLFIVFSGFLSCIDTSIMMTDEIRLAIMLENQNIKERTRNRLTKIVAKRDKHMAAMMVFSTLTTVLSNSMLGAMAYGKMKGIYVVVFMIMLTYGSLVFARTLPKIIARIHFDKILMRFDWLARLIYIVMLPMVYMTLVWVDLFNLSSKRQMTVSELKSTINFYRQEGLIEQSEENMLQNVFRIKKFTLNEVTQSTRMPVVDEKSDISSCKELAQTYFGKHILVKSEENIVGVMFYHDIAARIISEKGGKIEDICRPLIHCKAQDNLMDVLARMKAEKTGLVLSIDESGNPLDVVSAKRIYTHILTSTVEQQAPRVLG